MVFLPLVSVLRLLLLDKFRNRESSLLPYLLLCLHLLLLLENGLHVVIEVSGLETGLLGEALLLV